MCVCVCTRTHRSAVDPQAGPVVRHHEEVLVHGLAEAGPVELGRDHGGHLACMRGQRRERRGERLSQLWWTRAGTAEDQQQTTHALAWRYAQYREENIGTFLVSQISVHYLQTVPLRLTLTPQDSGGFDNHLQPLVPRKRPDVICSVDEYMKTIETNRCCQ